MSSVFQEPRLTTADWDSRSNSDNTATSAVSWGAILAGAAGAAALSLILVILGTGLGLSAISPWAYDGVSAAGLGVSTILWITFTQLAASGMGGYLAGRLRTRWLATDTDEVYFRDTAHGFLAWAIASLATAVLLTSVIGSIIGGGIKAGASLAGTVASASGSAISAAANSTDDNNSGSYFIDSLFRKNMENIDASAGTADSFEMAKQVSEGSSAKQKAEISRIFATSALSGALSSEDLQYAGQVIAEQTGLTQEQARERVSAIYQRLNESLRTAEGSAKAAADKARKASAYTALWLFISLLCGAFVASWMATFGGRQRDL